MSGSAIPLLDLVLAMKDDAERHRHRIHPSGAGIIHCWLVEMLEAASKGNGHEVKRLADMVQDKLRLERLWRIESWLNGWHGRIGDGHHGREHRRIACWLREELGYG